MMNREPVQPTATERRHLLRTVASVAGLALSGCAATGATSGGHANTSERDHEEAEVTPGEDLMQEHGVLERILVGPGPWSLDALLQRRIGIQARRSGNDTRG